MENLDEITKAFIRVLCSTNVSESTIHGITSMMWENIPAMDELVDWIDENPTATEVAILAKAEEILGM